MIDNRTFLFSFLFVLLTVSQVLGQGETCMSAEVISTPGLVQADGPSSGNGCYNCSPGTPGGIPAINADWYIFTPASSGLLTISSCDGGADTRIWVYTGDCNNLTQIAANDDFCDFAPQEPYAAAIENLPVTGGETYYLEWDDAWDVRAFSFEISLSPISENLAIDGWPLPFTSLPKQQLSEGIPIPVNVKNQGSMQANMVQVATEVWDATANLPIDTFLTDTFSLFAGQNRGFVMGPLSGLDNGEYFLVQKIIYQGPDDMTADNESRTSTFSVTSNEFSTDDGNYDGGIGIAGPGIFYVGQYFDMYAQDTIQSVRFNSTGGNPGDTIIAFVYSYNNFTGSPQDLILQSDPFILNGNNPDWKEIVFQTPLPVEAGDKFLFGIEHHATGTELNLGVSPVLYKPNNGWFALDNPNWVPIEALNGPGATDYNLAFSIRPVTDLNEVAITFSVDMREETIAADGVWLEYGIQRGPIGAIPLEDQGNGIYSGTLSYSPFSELFYVFSNGFPLTGGDREIVPVDCSEPGFLQIRTRKIQTGSIDMLIPKVCFESCTVCPPAPCDDPDFLICDDVEYYNLGEVTVQAPHWDTWDNDSDGGVVTNLQAQSGSQSIRIDGDLSGLSQDVLLQLDNSGSGKYSLSFELYIPNGKSAYFGLLHQRNPEAYGWDIYLDRFDQGYIYQGINQLTTFDFQSDNWMGFTWEIDLENDFNAIFLDGTLIWSGQFSEATDIAGNPVANNLQLASINFYPFDNLYEFYIDDVYFKTESVNIADHCFGALALDTLFGHDFGVPQVSSGYSNANFTTDPGDETNGIDCFTDISNPWQQTIWFSFEGDGSTYDIRMLTDPNGPCGIQTPFTNGDAQFAIFSGSCDNLTLIDCSENGENSLAPASILETQAGTQYFIIVDGTDIYSSLPEGEFCMQVTRIEPTVEATFHVDMRDYVENGGVISNEGILLGGSVVAGQLQAMQDNGDGTFSSTLALGQNKSYDYRFYNGTNEPENLDLMGDCLEPDSMQGRWLVVADADLNLDTVCFEYCQPCDSLSLVAEIFPANAFSLAPNPTSGVTTLSVIAEGFPSTGNITIFNPLGKRVNTYESVQLPMQIRCNDIPKGIYWIEFRNEKGKISLPLVITE